MEVEIDGHQSVINKVLANGNGLISVGHFASADIDKQLAKLNKNWEDLKAKASSRRRLLDEAVQRQAVSYSHNLVH